MLGTAFGLLLVVNETNTLVGCLLSGFDLETKTEMARSEGVIAMVDTRAYDARRVIGILEGVVAQDVGDGIGLLPLVAHNCEFTGRRVGMAEADLNAILQGSLVWEPSR